MSQCSVGAVRNAMRVFSPDYSFGTENNWLGSLAQARVVFVEKRLPAVRYPWSPKRLHLTISPTKGEFNRNGYESQVRISLSLRSPRRPVARSICSEPPGVFSRYDRRRGSHPVPRQTQVVQETTELLSVAQP